MEPKRLPKRAAPAHRQGSPPPGLTGCPECGPAGRGGGVGGALPAGKPGANAVYTVLVEDARRRQDPPPPAAAEPGGARDAPKSPLPCNGQGLLAEAADGWLRRLTDPLVLNGTDGRTAEELPRLPAAALGCLAAADHEAMLRVLDAGLEQCLALHSAYIPVPRQRKLSGQAGLDEVMAAAVLTSLSSSPLVLGPPPGPPGAEPGGEAWKEAPAMSSSCSSSSNTSGDWSWDPASDRSSPSTPSPPLPAATTCRGLLPAPPPGEEPDGTHFVFGDPIPRKRKNSTKVMFKCLWKSCGKVLSSSSGMQKHIRTVHLGRKADLEQSDGEEDFYYTELDVNVDSLTDGLSSLTPVSPTSSVPPAFPVLEAPGPAPALASPELARPPQLSQSAPTSLCHVHTDHAYQGCPAPLRPVAVGEKRPQVPPAAKTPAVTAPALPKPPAAARKPRGDAKKCRKVYGMENRDMWCTACRWKKACQRFVD
ncbi:SLC2A4 regulator [Struthio camelus]|uniref:SLC2A4 regulator n=1 Tax=Struthio camelus TaxID=8801 RepID=UPI0036041C97